MMTQPIGPVDSIDIADQHMEIVSPTIGDIEEGQTKRLIDSRKGMQSARSHQSSINSNLEEPNKIDLIITLPINTSEQPYVFEFQNDLPELDEEAEIEQITKEFRIQQHNFEKISKSMEQNKAKWKQLEDWVPVLKEEDDSDNQLINRRILELKSMCSSVIQPEYILDSLPAEIQEYALSLSHVSRQEFEEEKRSTWTALDYFKYGARMAHLISIVGNTHIKRPWWQEQYTTDNLDNVEGDTKYFVKHSINYPLRLSLITNPRFRTKTAIQQIIWFNQTVGAFTDLFPSEMETELAKCISYEMYENDRVIQCQGNPIQKLYYIIAGKIELIYVYKLMQGEVHKSMGFLTHNQMNNLEDVENGVPSATYMVARGKLEVLTLHREDYLYLTNKTNSRSIQNFLNQISIFKEFTISQSTITSHLIQIQYFKNEKVITQDCMKDLYFYVIKSGTVAVTRRQNVYDHDMSHLWSSSSVYSLGCQREGSHASAMIEANEKRLQFKPKPRGESAAKTTENPGDKKRVEGTVYIKPHTSTGSRSKIRTVESKVQENKLEKSRTMVEMKRARETSFYQHKPPIKKPLKHEKRLTGERLTYVKLDSLKPFDVFGLETLEKTENAVKSDLILISEGAELILVNKRYFLHNVDNNTLLEIRKLVKSYMSEQEAKTLIDNDNKWRTYKKILMQKMISLHC